jgi:hypothetical protein
MKARVRQGVIFQPCMREAGSTTIVHLIGHVDHWLATFYTRGDASGWIVPQDFDNVSHDFGGEIIEESGQIAYGVHGGPPLE